MSEISRKYKLSYNSVCHHKDNHLTRQLVKSQEIKDLTAAETVARDVSQIYRRLNRLLDDAEARNKTSTFLSIAAEIRSYSEFLLRLQATFERMAAEDRIEREYPEGVKIINMAEVSDAMLLKLIKVFSTARDKDGERIKATPIRDTLH